MLIEILKKPFQINKSYKRIEKIYSEITNGLEDGSMPMSICRAKIEEAQNLISKTEALLKKHPSVTSFYE